MKKLILLAAVFAFSMKLNAQVLEVKSVPQPVVTTFQTAYPSITQVTWKKDGVYYVAEYRDNDNDTYVTYDATGKFIEQGVSAPESALPASATTYVKTKYKGDHIVKVYKIKDANGKTVWKGKVKQDYVMFDENGNPMKMKRDD